MEVHEVHEVHEKIHEAVHGGHDSSNRMIALLIGVLAVMLAIVEIGGKGAQNASLADNITASNLWAFYQAKTIRMTTLNTAADGLEIMKPTNLTPEATVAWDQRIATWRADARRYDSDPEKKEGRKELFLHAKEKEVSRDRALSAYHIYEYAAAAFQIGIVLASSAVVTGAIVLAWCAGGLGMLGVSLGVIAWWAPMMFH